MENEIICISSSDEELISLYQGADALVFCSFSEGLGFPILEAMSLGIPVITSNLSSMKEIAQGAAELVNPHSVESIMHGILNVVDDDVYRDSLIQKGFERIKQFSWKNCAEKTLNLYFKVLDK